MVDEQGNGVVRSDGGDVVAGFLVEDVGAGWYVTTVETCVDG